MIYFYNKDDECLEGHVNDEDLRKALFKSSKITTVHADGAELVHAWQLLGRSGKSPNKMHSFTGRFAREIALNW